MQNNDKHENQELNESNDDAKDENNSPNYDNEVSKISKKVLTKFVFNTKPKIGTRFLSLYKNGEIRIDPDKKILKQSEISALLDIAESKKEVYNDIVENRKKLVKELSIIKDQAETEGFKKGLEKVSELIVNQEKMYFETKAKLENMIYEMSFAAVRKIINEEIDTKPYIVKNVVEQAAKIISDKKNIVIFVNKNDLNFIKDEKKTLFSFFESAHSVKIEEMERVEKGGCLIQTEDGILNANISSMIDSLEKSITKDVLKQK